jgi:hypothetical protein
MITLLSEYLGSRRKPGVGTTTEDPRLIGVPTDTVNKAAGLKRRGWLGLVTASLLMGSLQPGALAQGMGRYPVMQLKDQDLQQIQVQHARMAQTRALRSLGQPLPSSVNLLSYLPYKPAERNQGACGNCWAWAGTGIIELANSVQNGVKDRLSVQFINTCNTTRECCEGGWLKDVSDFYQTKRFVLPWSNPGAAWRDGDGRCSAGECASISTSTKYPLTSVALDVIPTHGVGTSKAIDNVREILNEKRGVFFAFFMPKDSDWNRFFDFWDQQPETAIWKDFVVGQPRWDAGGGGHAVLCVGYNMDDPANPYWIMVNSWGTAGGRRPNGIFRVAMNLNYDLALEGTKAIYWQTLDLSFNSLRPPSNMAVTSVSSSQVQLRWNDNSSNETGFKVQRATGTGSFSTLTTLPANATSHTDSSVKAGAAYRYRAVALSNTSESKPSNEASATIPIQLTAPALASPSNGQKNVAVPTLLDWKDVKGAAQYQVNVEYQPSNGGARRVVDTTVVNSSGYTCKATEGGRTYSWKVRAKNGSTYGPWSTERRFTTKVTR